jgi:TonB family protein
MEAFVPNLHPIKLVEPVWPAEARSAPQGSMVKLLVTVDSNGTVAAAEALAGLPVLQKPAVDAILQWQFPAVMRKGRPVRGLTTQVIEFLTPGQLITAKGDSGESQSSTRRVVELMKRFPRSREEVLSDSESFLAGASNLERYLQLPALAKAAFKAGDLPKALSYANDALDPEQRPKYAPDGDAVHDGNMVLGLIALQHGDVVNAKQYLLKAGETTGSPVLGSFGPNMSLAKALLEAGEREAVLQYFEECRAFWKLHPETLDSWSATVGSGGKPNFGVNLLY